MCGSASACWVHLKKIEGTRGCMDGAKRAKMRMRNTGKHLNMDDCACASGSGVFHQVSGTPAEPGQLWNTQGQQTEGPGRYHPHHEVSGRYMGINLHLN